MLIFDSFPSVKQAERFAASIKHDWKRNATVFMSQEESNRVDPFPYVLDPPIVLVERLDDLSGENPIIRQVKLYDGIWAGT